MARRTFGTVRQLPSGRHQARYRGPDGKQVSAPKTFATKTDANRWLAKVEADLARGTFFDPSVGTETLAIYAERWIDTRLVRGRPLAPRTAELYRSQLRNHLGPAIGSIELRHLDAATVRRWYAKVSGPMGPGQSTAAKCYRLLRAICQSAMEDDLIARNPCTIRGAGQEATTDRPMFTLEQVSRLTAAVEPRWRVLVQLAAWTGLRLGELAALRRKDLDLRAGTVTVERAVVDVVGKARTYGPPKSAAGKRTVAVPPHLLDVIEAHLATYAEPGPDGLIFVGPKGGPIRRNNFSSDVWLPAARAAELPEGSHFHDLRGFALTIAARHGATTRELMHRAGHSSPAMALRYQRAEADRDAALAAAMSEALRHAEGTMAKR